MFCTKNKKEEEQKVKENEFEEEFNEDEYSNSKKWNKSRWFLFILSEIVKYSFLASLGVYGYHLFIYKKYEKLFEEPTYVIPQVYSHTQ